MFFFFFLNDTAPPEIYSLSLHDALPICLRGRARRTDVRQSAQPEGRPPPLPRRTGGRRSEEHTSELQSRPHLVCRLLLEKKKKIVERDDRHAKKCRS